MERVQEPTKTSSEGEDWKGKLQVGEDGKGDNQEEEPQRWEKESEKGEKGKGEDLEKEKGFLPPEQGENLARGREDLLHKLPQWKQRFILSMRKAPHVTAACLAANCSTKTIYEERETDKLFQALWDESITYATDRLEGTAWTRAVDGIEKGVYGRDGQVIAMEKVYSDKLLETLLKGNLPQKYRENNAPQVTVNVLNWSNGGAELPQPVEDKSPLVEMSEDDVELLGE